MAVGVEVRAVRISTLPIPVAVAKVSGFTVARAATAKARVVKSVSFIVDEIVEVEGILVSLEAFCSWKIKFFVPFRDLLWFLIRMYEGKGKTQKAGIHLPFIPQTRQRTN